MTTIDPPVPPPFTGEDFAARMRRVVESAVEKGLAGVIVTPGPDLGLAHRLPANGDH